MRCINNVLSAKTEKLGVGRHFKGNLSRAKYWGRMPKMFSFQLPIVEKLPTTLAVDNRTDLPEKKVPFL